jgi:hypothetical protein
MSPLQLAATGLPQQGNIPLDALQADEAIAQVQAELVHLPDDDYGQQRHGNQSWQMKEGIQYFLYYGHPIFWQTANTPILFLRPAYRPPPSCCRFRETPVAGDQRCCPL